MARGFLSGIVAGAVVAAAGVVGLSLVIDPPEPPKPDAVDLGVPAGSEFNQSRKDEQAELPGDEPGPQTLQVPQVEAPVPDDLASLETSDTRPAEAPQTGEPSAELSAPGEANAPGLAVESDAPVPQAGASNAPTMPAQEPEMSISTDPAQPRPPEAETGETAFAPTEEPEATAPSVLSEAPAEPLLSDLTNEMTSDLQPIEKDSEKPNAMEAPATESAPETEELVIRVDPEPARPGTSGAVVEPEADDGSPADVAEPEAEEHRDDLSEASPEAPGSEREEREGKNIVERRGTPEAGEEEDSGPVITIGKPATRLTERGDRIMPENRPMIGTAATSPASRDTPESDTGAPTLQRPFEKYKEAFEDTQNKPKMAIVLIDDPDASVGIEALSTFPYALSFAVDTSRPGAADRMAIYRSAGFEVLAMVDLPEGAGAGDVEVAMQVLLERVPEAVGVMEAPGDGIQSSREIVTQVTEIVENSGHGLLLYPKGLDTGRKLASRAGVPAASIFRDFDAKDEKPSVIRRFLSYAALKAGSEENGVVMVGRLRPDTVTALLLWGLEDRARDIALTPVSAIMQAHQE